MSLPRKDVSERILVAMAARGFSEKRTTFLDRAALILVNGSGNARLRLTRAIQAPFRKRSQLVALIVLAAWLLWSWSQLFETILNYYNPLPIWDYWRAVIDLKEIQALHFQVLWTQHNDHRIIFPEIIFLADMLLFRGRQILPLILSTLCYVSMWALVARTLVADANLSAPLRAVAILLTGTMMAWRGCAQVVGVPFLLQWTLLQAMVFLALELIFQTKRKAKNRYLAGCIACAVVASYSAVNGLLIWPILLLAGWILGLSRRQICVLTLAAVISSGVFFIGYHSTGSLNLHNLLIHPVYAAEFVFSYLSVPFGLIAPFVGVAFGAASLAAFAILCTIAARSRMLATEAGIVLFGSYCFTLMTALLISSGRMDPRDPTFLAAKAERFVSTPLVTWAVLIAAALWVTYRRGWKVACYVVVLAVVVLLMKVLPRTRVWVQSHDNPIREQQWATLSLENGVFDPELVRKIYPDPKLIEIYLPVLRQHQISIYSFAYSKWNLQPASSFFVLPRLGKEAGEVTQAYPVTGGLEVMGWAEGVQRATYFPKILFLDSAGTIVGFGRRLKMGLPVGLTSLNTPSSIAWIGFIKLTQENRTFTTYVVDRRTRELTLIGGVIPFPKMQAVTNDAVGPPIANISWGVKGEWKSLIPPGVDPGTPPSYFLASWAGNDDNTGTITSSTILAPADHCLILPVLHGPRADALSARVVNSATNETVATVPMQGGGAQWKNWRIALDPKLNQLRITAEDQGRNWGEWLGIGTPSQCR